MQITKMLHNPKEVIYRNYTEADEKAIFELFQLAFQKECSASAWSWAYKENPLADINIVLGFYKSKLIAHSAGVPLLFLENGKQVSVLRIQNVMVNPDFRRMGIFLQTMHELESFAVNHGVDSLIAFPNGHRHSFAAFKEKLGYQAIFDIPTFSLQPGLLKDAVSQNYSIDISENSKFAQNDEDFTHSCLLRSSFFNIRNPSYLDWRYHKNSGKKYYIARVFEQGHQVGFIVCKLFPDSKSLDLVEFFFEPKEAAIHFALFMLLKYFGRENISMFSIWSKEHYLYHQCLMDIGFKNTGFLTRVVYKALSKRSSVMFDQGKSYYLSMGDSDVY